MPPKNYIMESEEETVRLDIKTDISLVREQMQWAGLRKGMIAADLGCGPGKTTFCMNEIVQPKGTVLGVDFVKKRIDYANKKYKAKGIDYKVKDIRESLDGLGSFDFILIRFVLEYYLDSGFDIVKNTSKILKSGGTLCLIDLDYNCLSHYGLPIKLESALLSVARNLMQKANFDPYAGRKLYSFLYDMGFEGISVNIVPHHLIYGTLNNVDEFNWKKKVGVAAKNSGYSFDEYEEGYEGFYREFQTAFFDQRRFSYTPAILCKGVKP